MYKKPHKRVKNEKNEKPKGELCRKKTKQLILSKVLLYFLELHCVPGAACGAVLMQKHCPCVKQVIVIPLCPSFTSKAHHISSCTWNSGACWSERWFLTNGKQRVPLTIPDALLTAEVSRCAVLHGSNYTHILIARQHLPGGSWRWSEKEQIPAWANVHIHSHFRVHICCVLNVALNGLCIAYGAT